jgi:hypothetical protein
MKFAIYTFPYKNASGGIIVLYNLSKNLHDLGHDVLLYSKEQLQENILFNKFGTPNTTLSDDTIAIYPEIIPGNPLKAKRVIRWILCELGRNSSVNIWKTWSPDDIVYFYSSYTPKIPRESINVLFSIYINPEFISPKPKNKDPDLPVYYIIRKGNKYHKTTPFYTNNQELLSDKLTHDELISKFTKCKLFICYDPYSYIAFIAAMCGCPCIVHPIPNISKDEWLNTLFIGNYLLDKNKKSIAGISYGLDELEYAKSTIDNVISEQLECQEFGKQTVHNMCFNLLNDMNHKYVKDYWA